MAGEALTKGQIVMGAGIGALAIVLVAVWSLSREVNPPRPAPAALPVPAPSLDPVRLDAEAKMNAAYDVWIAYGKLPPEKRNKATWGEALAEAATHGANLRPPYDRQFQAANQAVARKHMAPLVNPETRAVGENFVVLVPSADRVKCLLWAAQWSEETEALRTLGFEKLRCDGGKHVSNITGKEVEDPPREWAIQ